MDISDFDHIHADPLDNPARGIFAADEIERHAELAHRMLRLMRDGHRVSRLNCEALGLAAVNSSIHSAASFIQNELDVPVSRERTDGAICEYWLEPEVIAALADPDRREKQAIETRRETTAKRQSRRIAGYLKLIRSADEYPAMLDANPLLIQAVRRTYQETASFLAKINRQDKVSPAANQDMFDSTHSGEVEHG